MIEGEVWKDITGYEGLYQISNLGSVKSFVKGKEHIMKLSKQNKGYLLINLCKNGIHKKALIHRLVAEAFLPNPNNWPCVNHKDEDKTNNCETNLEWCTYSYNCNYGTKAQRAIETLNLNHRKNREKPILQFTLDGKFLAEYKSIKECERQTGFPNNNFPYALKGKYKTLYGYIWKYKNEEDK